MYDDEHYSLLFLTLETFYFDALNLPSFSGLNDASIVYFLCVFLQHFTAVNKFGSKTLILDLVK